MPRPTFAVFAITLAAASGAHADTTLYQQPLDPDFFGGAGSMARDFERFAEGFTVDEPAFATTVRWHGHKSGPGGSAPITGFELRFYNADGPDGAPGSTLYEQMFAWDDLAPQFSRELGGNTEYEFSTFVWSVALTSSGFQSTDAFGPGWIVYHGTIGSTFEVVGSVVPAPSAAAMALLTVAFATRRRRA